MFTKLRHVYTAVKLDTTPRVQLNARHSLATANMRTSGRCRLARSLHIGLLFIGPPRTHRGSVLLTAVGRSRRPVRRALRL